MRQKSRPELSLVRLGTCILFILSIQLVVHGCARYTVNQPIESLETHILDRTAKKESEEIFMVLAFSGGGTRAAALSYGVLEALDRVEIPSRRTPEGSERRSLLDEVDMISSVSGGSVTAAYYGLYGEQTFSDFKGLFLYRNINKALFWQMLSPINLVRLSSPYYGRSDFAAAYYDKLLFHGATFGDLQDRNTADVEHRSVLG